MSPELTSEMEIIDLVGKKYVRIEDELVWDRQAAGHDDIVHMNRLPVERDALSGKIKVSDAGFIVVKELKLFFETGTYQLEVVGDIDEQNAITNRMALDILGPEKVYQEIK